MGQKERESNGAADLQTKISRNDVVSTADPDAPVGRNGRERQGCNERHKIGQHDDRECKKQAHVSHEPAHPQVHDDPKDREQCRREHADERAEPSFGGAVRRSPEKLFHVCMSFPRSPERSPSLSFSRANP